MKEVSFSVKNKFDSYAENSDIVIACVNENIRYSEEDFGIDLSPLEDVYFTNYDIKLAPTGIKVKLPKYVMASIVPRSSLHRSGLQIVNSPAVIDSGYRGDCSMLLWCFDKERLFRSFECYVLPAGFRTAQMIFLFALTPSTFEMPNEIKMCLVYDRELYDNFDKIFPSNRSKSGFGSTKA